MAGRERERAGEPGHKYWGTATFKRHSDEKQLGQLRRYYQKDKRGEGKLVYWSRYEERI